MTIRMIALLLAALFAAGPTLAAGVASPPGWAIEAVDLKGGPKTCIANFQTEGAGLSIVVEGGLVQFLVSSDALPTAQGEYPATVQVDDDPAISLTAQGSDSVVGLLLSPPLAQRLGAKARLTVTTAAHTFVFDTHDVAAAFDAAAQCAEAPTLAQHLVDPRTPIPGAGNWLLMANLPGVPNACSARLNGAEVDTILILNKDDKLVLGAGRPDWNGAASAVEVQLAVDGAEPVALKANRISTLVLTLITDPVLAERLRRARHLDWTMPFGRFGAAVEGLGAAVDAMSACKHQGR